MISLLPKVGGELCCVVDIILFICFLFYQINKGPQSGERSRLLFPFHSQGKEAEQLYEPCI